MLWGFPDRNVNHSCDPNAYEAYEDDAIYIVARRPIAANEEITFDYLVNNSGGDSWPCNCRFPRCISMTAADGFFGLLEARQIEYFPQLADWFVAIHRDRIETLSRRAGH